MITLRDFEPEITFLGRMYENPSPCDVCPTAERCQEKQLACLDFLHFVNTGKIRTTKSRKAPKAEVFKMAMES